MKLFNSIVVGVLLSTGSLAAYAASPYELTIENHFGEPLAFILALHPEGLPDLPQNFTLQNSESIHTQVLEGEKECYVQVNAPQKESGDVKEDELPRNAYWGVKIENKKLKLYGYLGRGIAYNWKGNRIVFCTPEDADEHGSCIY